MKTFDEAWAEKGYHYGRDALQNVRMGWELRQAAEGVSRSDAEDPGYWGWLQTYTGRKFFPLQPELFEMNILDLAHGCALENRFGGQTDEPYSVAQHCCIVSDTLSSVLGRPDLAYEGLMHDAAEGLIKDLPRDIKLALPEYKEKLEHPFERLIAAHFGLAWPWPAPVKAADNIALMTERRDLFRCINPDWVQRVEPLKERITPWDWRAAEAEFLDRFYALHNARHAPRKDLP